jgi:glycosyltransferase XagB
MFGPFFTLQALWRCAYRDLLAPCSALELTSAVMTLTLPIFGLLSILTPAILGLRSRRRLDRFIWSTPPLPLHYCPISVAPWLALFDKVFQPFPWFMTEHGARRARSAADPGRSLMSLSD